MQSHTGENMARAFVAVVERFGISAKVSKIKLRYERHNILLQVGTVTADNASNNDSLMDWLKILLPNFWGRHC